jgi:RNA polymerase sigma-70 factor (ECF subfamily)
MGEDLVQDTFMKTWSYLVKGGKIDVMKAFLYHVLNNLIVDEYRKKKTFSLDVLLEKGFEPGKDHTERLIDILDSKSAVLLIQQLPERYRKVMRMRHVQDLTLAEMSLITGQSKNTLAVQLHRGLEKLKLLYHHA